MYNKQKAYQYFNSRFMLKKTSQNWWAFDNPFDPDGTGKRKMAVHFQYGLVKCWRTEYKEHIVKFVQDYEDVAYHMAKDIINAEREADVELDILDEVYVGASKVSTIEMPLGYNSILEGKGTLGNRARGYLEDRGFDLEVLDHLGFGYCNEVHEEYNKDYFGYVIVPFKRNGVLYYYIGRDFMGTNKRYKNPSLEDVGIGKAEVIYNEDALIMCDRVFQTEGWSDAATMGKAGIATLGWDFSMNQVGRIIGSDVNQFVMLPDLGVDEKGKSFYQKACQTSLKISPYKETLVVDLSPLAELGKDPNEMGYDAVMNIVESTKPMTFGRAMEIIMG